LQVASNNSGSDSELTLTQSQIDDLLESNGYGEGETANLKWRVVALTDGISKNSLSDYKIDIERMSNLVPPVNLFLVGTAVEVGYDNSTYMSLFRDENNEFLFHYTGYFSAGEFKMLEVRGQWQPQWGIGSTANSLAVNDGSTSDPGAIQVSVAGYYTLTVDAENKSYTFASYNASTAATFGTMGIIGDALPVGFDGPDVDMTQYIDDPHKWYIEDVTLTQDVIKFRADDDWTDNWGGFAFPSAVGIKNTFDNIPAEAGVYDIYFNDLNMRYTFILQ
ncbi:SusF/SusE family outer membrane protein, partial [Fulvivirga sp. RKSG066]|uniref:SusF/SusE family outer membrane protein n=1 Tax=Fulvivirga aurantia TaxID=2529383 RepID=UPI0012BCD897